jgi:hypothetical protein
LQIGGNVLSGFTTYNNQKTAGAARGA